MRNEDFHGNDEQEVKIRFSLSFFLILSRKFDQLSKSLDFFYLFYIVFLPKTKNNMDIEKLTELQWRAILHAAELRRKISYLKREEEKKALVNQDEPKKSTNP